MLGVHVPLSNPLSLIPHMTKMQYDVDTFQVFLRNNRNLKHRYISATEIDSFNTALLQSGIEVFTVHAPYIMNLCRDDITSFERNVKTIREDLQLLNHFVGNKTYVIHPGSSLGKDTISALSCIKRHLEEVSDIVGNVTIALETMSGAGTQILRSPLEVEMLMCLCYDIPNISLCYDTCHVFASGNDVVETFERLKNYVSIIHLNGSKGVYNSKLDRHTNLSDGCIPLESIKDLLKSNASYKDVPVILETPLAGYFDDLEIVKSLMNF